MGFEPDPVARESAQVQGLDVYDGSCERLPAVVRDRLFDVIICRHALHHIIDPEARALKSCRPIGFGRTADLRGS